MGFDANGEGSTPSSPLFVGFDVNGEGLTPLPTCFHGFQRERGGFDPLPTCFRRFRRERGGFDPLPTSDPHPSPHETRDGGTLWTPSLPLLSLETRDGGFFFHPPPPFPLDYIFNVLFVFNHIFNYILHIY